MASPVMKRAAGTAASWLFAAACLAGSLIYFDELRSATSVLLGINPEQHQVAAQGRHHAKLHTAAGPRRIGGRNVTLKAERSGHFLAHAMVNGRPIQVMVDTGATIVALTYDDAQRAGIFVRPADFTHRVSTANGTARVAPITVQRIAIGDIEVHDVRAAVSEPGKLHMTLLGMAFLGRLSRTEIRGGTLVLEQ